MICCIACQSWSMKRVAPELALQGFGHCQNRAKGIVHHGLKERDCEDFKAEDAEKVAYRREWLQGLIRR